MENYNILKHNDGSEKLAAKMWTKGVPVDSASFDQIRKTAAMPFVHKWVAAMPDVHVGVGSTIGTVIPTKGAIIPAAVGVDIGCGMIARKTNITASELPDSLTSLRLAIEEAVPHGRTSNGGIGDKGSWTGRDLHKIPSLVKEVDIFKHPDFEFLKTEHPKIMSKAFPEHQIGTLGGGNHFIEVCLDENDDVWIMLHSGSRGIGNKIGRHFIGLAKKEMERFFVHLPDKDLSYLPEGTQYFDDYVKAVGWAQEYARINREIMMALVIEQITKHIRPFAIDLDNAVNCHHNYVERENHYGENVWVTRKGAVRARMGDLGIIPGSMGAKSFIVEGLGNPDSFHSCSHGAGRVMSRTEAKKRITLEQHKEAVEGVESRIDESILDESPAAYKSIDDVMEAQKDLVRIRYTLKQVLCVKG